MAVWTIDCFRKERTMNNKEKSIKVDMFFLKFSNDSEVLDNEGVVRIV